jgi:arylsulfatase A
MFFAPSALGGLKVLSRLAAQALAAFVLLVGLNAGLPAFSAEPAAPPNIVFIMADDLGYGDLGCYGQKKIRTPRLDQMAKEGLRFTQFYSGSPVCAPSRCVLMTGKHAGHAAVRDNREWPPKAATPPALGERGQFPLPDGEQTIPELLKDKGYQRGMIGKWGLGGPDTSGGPEKQGFGSFFGYICQAQAHNHYPGPGAGFWKNHKELRELTKDEETTKKFAKPGNGNFTAFEQFGTEYSGDLFEEQAIEFLHDHKDKPFFLYLPFTIPHLALQVPDDSLREYEDKWDDPPYDGKQGYLPHPTPRAAYAAMVTRLDRTVGRILDELKELGLEENTLVVFTSDNGPCMENVGGADSKFFESAGPFRGLKGSGYEGGIRVPFIARWPGKIAAEKESSVPLAFYDVLPTVCELAGVKAPENLDGLSFVPTLLGREEQKEHDFLYWEFPSYEGYQVVRMGDWKAIRPRLKKKDLEIELYNLLDDVGEKKNLAAEKPELVKKAEEVMAAQHVPSENFLLPTVDMPMRKEM